MLYSILGFSQNKTDAFSLSFKTIINYFEKEKQLKFSYDPEAFDTISLKINTTLSQLTIAQLIQIISTQTQYSLQKIDQSSYIVITDNTPVTICGVLVDQTSNSIVHQATILKNKRFTTLSNKKGLFYAQVLPQDIITINYTGYQSKALKATAFSNSVCDTIYLKPLIETLNDVIIEEYLTTGIYKSEDAAIRIANKKLRILPGLVDPDVLQSAQLLPGISSPTEDPASLYIRGGTPEQNLILWDGIKIYNTGHFFNQISTLNPYIVKEVEIYRGGTSVQYGDRISGVITVKSDDDVLDSLKVGGGLNLTHGDVYAKIPLSTKAGLLIAGRRSTTDIYSNVVSKNFIKKVFQNTRADIPDENTPTDNRKDRLSFLDTNLKFLWHPNTTNTISISTLFSNNSLDNSQNEQADFRGSFNTTDQLKLQNWGASIIWKNKINTLLSQKLILNTSIYNFDYNLFLENNDENFDYIYNQNNSVSDLGAEYAINLAFKKKHSLNFGYQFSTAKASVNLFNTYTDVFEDVIFDELLDTANINHTLYGEYIYNTEKAYLRFGVRNSFLTNTAQSYFVEPRIFTAVKLFQDLRLTSSFELKNQQITQFSTFGSAISDRLGVPGLPNTDNLWIISGDTNTNSEFNDLNIIKSLQGTLGMLYSKNGWHIDVEGYYKNINDISFSNDFLLQLLFDIEERILNSNEKRWGIDALIKKRIQNYRFWLGYTYNSTAVSIPRLQNGTFPNNFDQTHVFNLSQTLKVKKLDFALGWNYATGRPYSNFFKEEGESSGTFGISLDPNGINTKRLKNYHRLDASATYRFSLGRQKKTKGLFGISVRNIYNRKNEIDQKTQLLLLEEDNTDIKNIKTRSLRITPEFSFRLNF